MHLTPRVEKVRSFAGFKFPQKQHCIYTMCRGSLDFLAKLGLLLLHYVFYTSRRWVGLLIWLLFREVQLSMDEFLEAISIDASAEGTTIKVSKANVLYICYNLVVHDKVLNKFRFAHLSVREYLESQADFFPSVAQSYAAEDHMYEGRLHHLVQRFFRLQIHDRHPFYVWNQNMTSLAWTSSESMMQDASLKWPLSNGINWMYPSPPAPIFAACGKRFSRIVYECFDALITGRTGPTLSTDGLRLNPEPEIIAQPMTCLQIANNFGHLDIVDLLLDKGAELNKQTRSRLSALHFASGQGHGPVVQWLLDDRANVDIRDDRCRSALYHAHEKNQETVTQLLLDRGAKFDGPCSSRLLYIAAEAGNPTSLESLLAKGRGCSEQGQPGRYTSTSRYSI